MWREEGDAIGTFDGRFTGRKIQPGPVSDSNAALLFRTLLETAQPMQGYKTIVRRFSPTGSSKGATPLPDSESMVHHEREHNYQPYGR